jgi:hypothetical protein
LERRSFRTAWLPPLPAPLVPSWAPALCTLPVPHRMLSLQQM